MRRDRERFIYKQATLRPKMTNTFNNPAQNKVKSKKRDTSHNIKNNTTKNNISSNITSKNNISSNAEKQVEEKAARKSQSLINKEDVDKSIFAPLSRLTNTELKEKINHILEILEANDIFYMFRKPVLKNPEYTEIYSSYRQKIKNPMDFSSIRAKIDNYFICKNRKTIIYDFLDDLVLISENCIKFNKEKSVLYYISIYYQETLKEILEKNINKADLKHYFGYRKIQEGVFHDSNYKKVKAYITEYVRKDKETSQPFYNGKRLSFQVQIDNYLRNKLERDDDIEKEDNNITQEENSNLSKLKDKKVANKKLKKENKVNKEEKKEEPKNKGNEKEKDINQLPKSTERIKTNRGRKPKAGKKNRKINNKDEKINNVKIKKKRTKKEVNTKIPKEEISNIQVDDNSENFDRHALTTIITSISEKTMAALLVKFRKSSLKSCFLSYNSDSNQTLYDIGKMDIKDVREILDWLEEYEKSLNSKVNEQYKLIDVMKEMFKDPIKSQTSSIHDKIAINDEFFELNDSFEFVKELNKTINEKLDSAKFDVNKENNNDLKLIENDSKIEKIDISIKKNSSKVGSICFSRKSLCNDAINSIHNSNSGSNKVYLQKKREHCKELEANSIKSKENSSSNANSLPKKLNENLENEIKLPIEIQNQEEILNNQNLETIVKNNDSITNKEKKSNSKNSKTDKAENQSFNRDLIQENKMEIENDDIQVTEIKMDENEEVDK